MKTPERGFGSEGTAKTSVLGIPDLMLGETTNKKMVCAFHLIFIYSFSLRRDNTTETSLWSVVLLLACAKPVAPHHKGIKVWVRYLLFSPCDNPCCFRWFDLVVFLQLF